MSKLIIIFMMTIMLYGDNKTSDIYNLFINEINECLSEQEEEWIFCTPGIGKTEGRAYRQAQEYNYTLNRDRNHYYTWATSNSGRVLKGRKWNGETAVFAKPNFEHKTCVTKNEYVMCKFKTIVYDYENYRYYIID